MFNLFSKQNATTTGITIDPGFLYINRVYKEKLNTIMDYYHNRNFAVKNNHLLVKIIKTLNVVLDLSIYDYISNVTNKAPYLANTFRLTSPKNKGDIFDGIFYGSNSKEILLYVEEEYDLDEVERNWKTLEPIKVILHHNTDLSLALPKVNYEYKEATLSVFSVDIVLLALQYRGWWLDQKGNDIYKTVQQFVHAYVLPNMLPSQLKITGFNILCNLFNNVPNDSVRFKLPISTRDYTSKVNILYSKVLTNISRRKIRYVDALSSIPALPEGDMLTALRLPSSVYTYQNTWAYTLARLSVFANLLLICGVTSFGYNRQLINEMQISLKMLERNNILAQMLPSKLLNKQQYIIDIILGL